MEYYAKLKKQDDAYLVTFPDLPNVLTYGDTVAEALEHAKDALQSCLEADVARGFSLPESKQYHGKNYFAISVSLNIEIAYAFRELRKGTSQSTIAREFGISYQAYQKLENPRTCNPTVKTLERISKVYGKKLDIRFTE